MYIHTTMEHGINSDDMSNRIGRLEPGALPIIWPQIAAVIEAHGQEWLKIVTLESIYQHAANGDMVLWGGLDKDHNLECVAACMWEDHTRQRFFHVVWVGGKNLSRYAAAGLEKIEKWCLLFEGSEVVITARPGLERLLVKYGYQRKYVRLSKNVRRTRGN